MVVDTWWAMIRLYDGFGELMSYFRLVDDPGMGIWPNCMRRSV